MTTRNLTITLLAVLGAAALIAIWFALGHPGYEKKLPEVTSYRSASHGYAFSYPRTLELEETSGRRVAIGRTVDGSFLEEGVAQVIETDTVYRDFRTFSIEEIRRLCAGETDSAATTCGAVTSEEEIRTEGGLVGTAYSFTVSARASGAAATTTTFGPVYVFDVTSLMPENAHSAILVYPPISGILSSTPNTELLRQMADTITLGR